MPTTLPALSYSSWSTSAWADDPGTPLEQLFVLETVTLPPAPVP